TPVISAIYEMINPPATKIDLSIKQQIIPHLLNYKLVYLQIVLSSLGVIIIIRVLKNRKVQELIKKAYKKTGTVTQKIYYLSTK
ncbi:MAG: hypothetical protein Q8O03_01900, partial [Nanoarchaeota archaeon]|nr:hypothetical protein [Nanoarchaeota archaeon]